MSSPFNLQKVGDPLNSAVTVAELKSHLGVSNSVHDTYIGILADAATEMVEADFNIALVGQEYNLFLEDGFYKYYFYDYYQHEYYYGNYNVYRYPRIRLPILPVASILSITYTDITNAPQTLDPSLYVFKGHKDPPEIMLNGLPLPAIAPATDIVVDLIAGMGTYADSTFTPSLPIIYKQAIYLLVAAWYENREPVSESLVRPVPLSYERIKQTFQIRRFH